MDQNTVIAIAVVIITFFTFTYITMQEVFKFKLKKEQIKADALVRSEEIKAKNQLDIEALMQKDSSVTNRQEFVSDISSAQDEYLNERRNRINDRA